MIALLHQIDWHAGEGACNQMASFGLRSDCRDNLLDALVTEQSHLATLADELWSAAGAGASTSAALWICVAILANGRARRHRS